jgi:hypothetical protein
LQVGFQQLEGWQLPMANSPNFLPSFGDILQFSINIPYSPLRADIPSDLSVLTLGSSTSYSNDVNILAQLSPFGLLPHLWSIWEAIILGRDILVLSDTPMVASEVDYICFMITKLLTLF